MFDLLITVVEFVLCVGSIAFFWWIYLLVLTT